jgi:meso-butanediol dehydrogenase/(S,S)-butanediol dehydrogenase/diacetyl reductase
MEAFALTGRRILVTGGAQGIGFAVAELCSAAGAEIIIADLDEARARDAADRLVQHGRPAHSHALDVRDLAAVRRFAADCQVRYGDVYGIVNSAGVDLRERLEEEDFFTKWHMTFQVNLDGPMHVIHAFLDQLKRTRGAVVNLGSTCSFVAGNGTPAYIASKGALRLLTQSLGRQLSQYHIRVNAVAPAIVETPLTETMRQDKGVLARYAVRCPMNRFAHPSEIAGPVVMLLSDAASYMTGVTMPIDGGILS